MSSMNAPVFFYDHVLIELRSEMLFSRFDFISVNKSLDFSFRT